MILLLFMFCFFHLPWIKGASHSNSVFQTPPFIIKETGQSVAREINCSHSIPSYNRILWYKQDKQGALKFLGYLNINFENVEKDVEGKISFDGDGQTHSRLNISDLALNDSGVYFCAASLGQNAEAYFGGGTKLTVLEENLQITPPTVKVLPPSAKECKNKRGNAEKTIVCLASGFYPDHVSVSWQVGGEDVTTGVATDNAALRRKNKTYTITSRLRVSAKEWYNPDTEFKCTVSFYNGKDTEYNSDSISGDKAKEGVLTREKYLKITQTAKLSYGVFIVKSMVYGVFVAFLVWKLRNSSGKRNH